MAGEAGGVGQTARNRLECEDFLAHRTRSRPPAHSFPLHTPGSKAVKYGLPQPGSTTAKAAAGRGDLDTPPFGRKQQGEAALRIRCFWFNEAGPPPAMGLTKLAAPSHTTGPGTQAEMCGISAQECRHAQRPRAATRRPNGSRSCTAKRHARGHAGRWGGGGPHWCVPSPRTARPFDSAHTRPRRRVKHPKPGPAWPKRSASLTRRPMVAVDSSAARMPLPGATIFFAFSTSSAAYLPETALPCMAAVWRVCGGGLRCFFVCGLNRKLV